MRNLRKGDGINPGGCEETKVLQSCLYEARSHGAETWDAGKKSFFYVPNMRENGTDFRYAVQLKAEAGMQQEVLG